CGVPDGDWRLVPDVALEADPDPGNYVRLNANWYIVGGTSGAAPPWAGYVAEVIQRDGGLPPGNPGAGLYSLCGTSALHDVTNGSNGDYSAGPGYDLVTGIGSIVAQVVLAPTTTTTTHTTTTTTHTTTTTTTTAPTTTTTSSTTTTTAPTTTT